MIQEAEMTPRSLASACWLAGPVLVVVLLSSTLSHGQPAERVERWLNEQYAAALDAALPLGEWTGDSATEGAEWRVALRAHGEGLEWLLILVGGSKGTTGQVVVTAPIRDQLRAHYTASKGGPKARAPHIDVHRWRLAGEPCDAVRRAIEWMQSDGVRLAQPSVFALDGPIYEIRAEAISRTVAVSPQGLGADEAGIELMKAVRKAVELGQCSAR